MSSRPILKPRDADAGAVASAVTVLANGAFVIYRKVPRGFARAARPPRFRHPTFEAAQAEARRLAALHPESTFVILRELAAVSGGVGGVQ